MAADLITIIETVAVTQLLTPTGKALGETILERGKQVASKAVGYLAAAGREPQSVEPKLLVPLIQAASLESDPTLIDHWAALLANAADILGEVEVIPAYSEILKQLAAPEAKLLTMLFAEATKIFYPLYPLIDGQFSDHFKQPAMRKAWALDREIDVAHIGYKLKRGQSDFDAQALIKRQRFQAMIDNLLRQRLIVAAKDEPIKASGSFEPKPGEVSRAFFTSLGYDFMLAVTPPTP